MSLIFTAKSVKNPSINPKILKIVVFRHLTTKIRQIKSGKLLIFHLYWTLRRAYTDTRRKFRKFGCTFECTWKIFTYLLVLFDVLENFFCDFTCTWAENDSFCCTCTFVLTWKFHDLSTCTYVPDFDQVHVLARICTCTFEVYTLLLYEEKC